MRVKTLKVRTLRLDAINTKSWPAGWSGDVPDELAAMWIAEGAAVAGEPVQVTKPVEFTVDQAAVLAAAANEILKAAAVAGQEDAGDPDEGDPDEDDGDADAADNGNEDIGDADEGSDDEGDEDTGEGDTVPGEDEDGEVVDLSTKSNDELRAIAESLGVSPGRKKRAALIAAIEAKASELQAAGENS